MSFRRSIVTLLAVLTLASPVFAADAPTADSSADSPATDVATQPTDMTPDANKPDDSSAQDSSTQSDASKTTNTSAADDIKKVNINTASAKALTKIKGISVYRARQLVAYRKKNGNFTTLEDLQKVKGFIKLSEEQLNKIKDQLKID